MKRPNETNLKKSKKITSQLTHTHNYKYDGYPFYLDNNAVALIAARRLAVEFPNNKVFYAPNIDDFITIIKLLKQEYSETNKPLSACFLIKESDHYEFAFIHKEPEKRAFALVLDSVPLAFTDFQLRVQENIVNCFPNISLFTNYSQEKSQVLQKDLFSCSIFALNWAFRFCKIGTELIINYFKEIEENYEFSFEETLIIKLSKNELPIEFLKLMQVSKEDFRIFLEQGNYLTEEHKQYLNQNEMKEHGFFAKHFNQTNRNQKSINNEIKWQEKYLQPFFASFNHSELDETLREVYGLNLYSKEIISTKFTDCLSTPVRLNSSKGGKVKLSIDESQNSSIRTIFCNDNNDYAFEANPDNFEVEIDDESDIVLKGNPRYIFDFLLAIRKELHPLKLRNQSSSIITLDLTLYKMFMVLSPYLSQQIKNKAFVDFGLIIKNNQVILLKTTDLPKIAKAINDSSANSSHKRKREDDETPSKNCHTKFF